VRCEKAPGVGRNAKVKCGKLLFRTDGRLIAVKCQRCGGVSIFALQWLFDVSWVAGEWGEPARVPHRCRMQVEPTMELCNKLLFVADGDGIEAVCSGDKCKAVVRFAAEKLGEVTGCCEGADEYHRRR
jgi:phage FluMu protein Com